MWIKVNLVWFSKISKVAKVFRDGSYTVIYLYDIYIIYSHIQSYVPRAYKYKDAVTYEKENG